MAKESFNIISQGQIDDIISDKPQDRRIMIEEAASVLKYKYRKEDALKKLEKTNDNINRVNDIIKELEKQVEPLKIEKQRALLHIEKKEELQNIEIALITSDITNLNYKYKDKKAKIQELNKEIINITTTNNTNEAKILQYKVRQTELENKIKQNQEELLKLTELSEKLNSQKKIILERQKYEVNDSKLHENIINLKEKQLKIENEVNALEFEINTIKKELETKEENISNKEQELAVIKSNKKTLENKLTNTLRNILNLKQKINNLKETLENNNSLPLSVRSVLNNPLLDGIHNTIGNIIEVEEKYSKAITTSLGANANNIIVKDEEKAKQAGKRQRYGAIPKRFSKRFDLNCSY